VTVFGRRPALVLDDDPATRFLPWIVALTVFFATLAVAGALVLDGASGRWRGDDRGSLTVELPAGAPVEAALAVVLETTGVVGARALDRGELLALIEPWLPAAAFPADLPLPRLLDVTVDDLVGVDVAALGRRLAAAVPGARIDDSALERRRLRRAARALEAIALLVIAVTAATAVGVVVVATRSSLAVHHETIELLHLIGASDGFVATSFAREALGKGLRGGLLGLVPAAAALVVARHFTAAVTLPMLPRLDFSVEAMVLIAALPLVAAALAMLTARLTVLRALARLS